MDLIKIVLWLEAILGVAVIAIAWYAWCCIYIEIELVLGVIILIVAVLALITSMRKKNPTQ